MGLFNKGIEAGDWSITDIFEKMYGMNSEPFTPAESKAMEFFKLVGVFFDSMGEVK